MLLWVGSFPFHICPSGSPPLRWRHNDHAGVSNHQPHGCLLNRLFRRKSKKTSKLCVTGLCAGNSPGTGEFPAQMASYAENVSIWWRHHALTLWQLVASVPVKQLYMCIINGMPLVHGLSYNDVIKWKHFSRYWPFVRGIHRSRWNPLTKVSDAELWCFLWSTPGQTVE